MMFTKEEYNSKINELIEVCNWCKRVKLTCEECVNVYGRCIRNKGILTLAEELTKNEHFDNPPLKFEDLKHGMVVWDKTRKTYIQILSWVGEMLFYEFGDETPYKFEFEEYRFYRYEVKE